jgi:hypothetical protein
VKDRLVETGQVGDLPAAVIRRAPRFKVIQRLFRVLQSEEGVEAGGRRPATRLQVVTKVLCLFPVGEGEDKG